MRFRLVVVASALVGLISGGVGATASVPATAPPAASTARPGPPVLYWPAATAPQLQNVGSWQAAPLLVSGAAAYRGGEYLYQDYLYDDHGAREQPDPSDPRTNDNNQFSTTNGTPS